MTLCSGLIQLDEMWEQFVTYAKKDSVDLSCRHTKTKRIIAEETRSISGQV